METKNISDNEPSFLDWFEGKCNVFDVQKVNYFERAFDVFSQKQFNKPYSELLTYEKRYVAMKLLKPYEEA